MLFQYFKEIDESKIIQTDKGKKVDYPYLESYWTDKNREALYVLFHNKIAGFCLINDWIVCEEFKAEKAIAEFYIKPEYRRKGIGRHIVSELFYQYQTKWEIRQSATNIAAIQFWRSVIAQYTKGNYEEKKIARNGNHLVIQLFNTR